MVQIESKFLFGVRKELSGFSVLSEGMYDGIEAFRQIGIERQRRPAAGSPVETIVRGFWK
jgi:hypothetical protein